MKSERQYRKQLNNQYDKRQVQGDDTTHMQYKQSHFKQVALIAGALSIGAIGVRNGSFKNSISNMIQYASKHDGKYAIKAGAMRDWMNHLDEAVIKEMKKENPNFFKKGSEINKNIVDRFYKQDDMKKSIFRHQSYNKMNYGDLMKAGTRNKFFNDLQKNLQIAIDKDRIKHTKNDLKGLKNVLKNIDDKKGSITDSTLFKDFKDIDSIRHKLSKEMSKEDAKYKNVSNKLYAEMLKSNVVSKKEQDKMLKRTGHKYLTIGDLVSVSDNKNLSPKNSVLYHNFKEGDNLVKEIEELANKSYTNDLGDVKKLVEHKDFLNMKIDNTLLIKGNKNSTKELADLRGYKRYKDLLARTLTEDFKIPVVGINPFRIVGIQPPKDKINFAVLNKGSLQNSITGEVGKKGAINETMLFIRNAVYSINEDGTLNTVKKNMNIEKVRAGATMVSKELDGVRKMAGISKIDYIEHEGDSFSKRFSKTFDIGRQDSDFQDISDFATDNKLNPTYWINKVTDKAWELNPLKGTAGKKIVAEDVETGVKRTSKTYSEMFNNSVDKDVYVAMNNTVSLKAIFKKGENGIEYSKEGAEKFLKQFTSGRHDLNNVTTATSNMFYLTDRVNTMLSQTGFGLGIDSLTSPLGVAKNMLLKRVLPVYAGYNILEQVIYATERKDENDEYNGKSNIKKDIAKGVVSMNLGYHKAKDFVGITALSKHIGKYLPGLDQIGDIPVLSGLKLDTTYEEQEDYYKHGKDAVRKGAFWDTGTTAYTGGKIDSFRDNWFKRAMAEVEFSDVKYGSREEYLSNSPFPTIANPLAPIKYFITDKYHWDKKHYNDRPYMQTSGLFQDIPLIGPIASSTIGRIIKPTLTMHKEDLNPMSNEDISKHNNTLIGLTGVDDTTDSEKYNNYGLAGSGFTGGGGSSSNGSYMPQIELDYTSGKNYKAPKLSYTPLNMNPGIDKGTFANDGLFFNHNNLGVNDKTITKLTSDDIENSSQISPLDAYSPKVHLNSSSGLKYNLSNLGNQSADYLGLYGFIAKTAMQDAFGSGGGNTKYIENSTYAYSLSRDFWDSGIGGIGGEGNEIIRRFLTKRTNPDDLYNPIKNTMPEWMPGSNYFINFKIGDPYVKVANGEERLPGEGYERLNGIHPLDFKIGASYLGKSKEEIINHFMNNDEVTSQGGHSAISRSNEAHDKVLGELEDRYKDYIIQKDGRVHDKINDIDGKYDLRIKDSSNRMGQSLLQVKTLSDEKFNEAENSNSVLEENKAQINFLLGETGLTNAYVMYVNRDDPNKRFRAQMEFDKGELKSSIKKLGKAKEDINKMLDDGTLSRGDFYSPLDKLRVLGDVAPYSEEYDQMASYVANMKLNKSEKTELKAIKDRVSLQRKPKRLYDYKYKNSDMKAITGEVDTVFDDNTFTMTGRKGRFRLAGVDIKSDEDWAEEDREKRESGEVQKGYNSKYLMEKQAELIKTFLHKGSNVTIEYNGNPTDRTSASGISKVIVSNRHGNLNKELLNNDFATENDGDTDVDIKVKTSALGRFAGTVWESYAHIDTPFHTKWLQVRDAKEDYERSRVYGNEMAQWNNPISDYLKPFVIDRNVERNLLMGVGMGVAIGKEFGRTPFGRIVGATSVALAVTGGKVFSYGYQAMTGEKWRPDRIRKEQELDDYIDKLKYLKYKKLYEEYNAKSNIDAKKILDEDSKNKATLGKKLSKVSSIAKALKIKHQEGKSLGLLSFTSATDLEGYNPFLNTMASLSEGKKGLMRAMLTDIRYKAYKDTHDTSNIDNAKVDKDHARQEFIDKINNNIIEKKINGKTNVGEDYDSAKGTLLGSDLTYKNMKKAIANTKIKLASKLGSKNPLAKSKLNYDKLATLASLQYQLKDNSIDDSILYDNLKEVGLEPYSTKKGEILREKTLKDVNKSVMSLSKSLGVDSNGLKALMYKKLSEQTMYGFEEGDPIENLLKAMPKKDKDYFSSLVNAPDKEKLEILNLAPKYMRRGLESSWGLKVEKKDDLGKYFTKHALPGEDWSGWSEGIDLNSVKVKMLNKEKMDFMQNNVWEDDVRKANAIGKIPIPKLNMTNTNQSSRRALMGLLKEQGYKDVQVSKNGLSKNTKLYLTVDKKAEYRKEINRKAEETLS